MAARLATPGGQAVHGNRAATIEPVFAQLTGRPGRNLHYRDDMAGAGLSPWAASHNLLAGKTIHANRFSRPGCRGERDGEGRIGDEGLLVLASGPLRFFTAGELA